MPALNNRRRGWPRVSAWARGLASLVLATGLLAACSSQFAQPFVADRLIAFGDEHSVIGTSGRKYSVNGLTDGTIDCNKFPIWVQELAAAYARPFPACAAAGATAASVNHAAPAATVDDLRRQVDAHLASDRFGEKDLVTMFVGLHDVLGEYAKLANDGESVITERLRTVGTLLGTQVNRVAQTGAPVLIVTVPDVGLSPFGMAEDAASAGRAALLRRLTVAFNTAMRLEIINDGRLIGLVDAFDLVGAMVKIPTSFNITNAVKASCLDTAALPDCTSDTLLQVNGAAVNPSLYLWADSVHIGPPGHHELGRISTARSRNNPF